MRPCQLQPKDQTPGLTEELLPLAAESESAFILVKVAMNGPAAVFKLLTVEHYSRTLMQF
jgi:hypothetical protein